MKVSLAILWLAMISGCAEFKITDSQKDDIYTLKATWKNLETNIGANLSQDPHCLVTRIDNDNRQTYFWIQNKIYFEEDFWLLTESFQSSGSILGPPAIPPPKYIWDGIDLRIGLGMIIKDFKLEGGPVLYTWSPTHRPTHWGALITLNFDF